MNSNIDLGKEIRSNDISSVVFLLTIYPVSLPPQMQNKMADYPFCQIIQTIRIWYSESHVQWKKIQKRYIIQTDCCIYLQ